MEMTWDNVRRIWHGFETQAHGKVYLTVDPEGIEPKLALSYAQFTWSLLSPRLEDAQRFAAQQLIEDYNYQADFSPKRKRVSELEFAQRLRIEGVRFRKHGFARIDFAHDLYEGHDRLAGGLVVVESAADGTFRQAYWVDRLDSQDVRLGR